MDSRPRLSYIEQHVIDCVRAAIAEMAGEEERASRIRAQGKLRMMCMSEEELLELAKLTCYSSKKSIKEASADLKDLIAKYEATSDDWLWQAFGKIPTGL